MSELLYNKSKAVEELNKVEGFYPLELARVISNEGQEEQRYLDVKYRKLWFRLVNPTGKIISRIVHFTENMAVVEARIYLDKCDQEDNYIANSFSQKFRTADTQFGDKFLEMAETAAIGRALADAGYGLQFADVGEGNDPMQVDIQTENKLLILHTIHGDVQSSQRMSELEKRLSKKQFFRCHNSYMVNFDYVEGVKKDSVLIKDKVQKLKTIPISKYKKEEFMRALARYVGKWEN